MENFLLKGWKVFLLFSTLFLLSFTGIKQANAGTLLITNVLSNSVSLFDDVTFLPIKNIKVGYMPHEVVVTTDGKYALVSNFGDLLSVIKGNTVTVIDIANAKVERTIELPKKSRPHGLAILSDNLALVTAQGIQSLLVVDFTTGALVKTVPLPGAGAHMVKVDSGKHFAYVANAESGTVLKIDLRDFSVAATHTVGNEVEGLAFNTEEDLLLTTDHKDNYVAVLNTKDLSLHKIFLTNSGPVRVETFANGKYALITNSVGGNAQVIDLTTFAISKGFHTTHSHSPLPVPINIGVRKDQNTAFITNSFAGDITLVDLMSGKILKTLSAGFMPDGVAISPVNAINTDTTISETTFGAGPIDINASIDKVWNVSKNVSEYERISHGAITAQVDGEIGVGKTITLELYKHKVVGKFIPKSEETVTVVDNDRKLLVWVRRLPDGNYTERYQILEKIADNITRSTIVLHIPGPIGVMTKLTLGKVINDAFNDLSDGIKFEAEHGSSAN